MTADDQFGDEADGAVEHTIAVKKVLVHRGDVTDPDRLLGQKERVNLHGRKRRVGVSLDVVEKLRSTYNCSCGEQFLEPETAADHLRETSPGVNHE